MPPYRTILSNEEPKFLSGFLSVLPNGLAIVAFHILIVAYGFFVRAWSKDFLISYPILLVLPLRLP